MSNLDDFLKLEDVENITSDVFVSQRLGTFKVKALTTDEYNTFINKARKANAKTGKVEFNTGLFNLDIINAKLISPDFANKEFLDKAKCSTAREFIAKKLLPGEIQDLSDAILRISGFENDINDDITEAKN